MFCSCFTYSLLFHGHSLVPSTHNSQFQLLSSTIITHTTSISCYCSSRSPILHSFNTDNVAEYREDLIFRPKTPPKKRKEGEELDGYTLVGERTELVKDEDTREYFLSKVRK